MKISIFDHVNNGIPIVLDVDSHKVQLSDVFCGVTIPADQGVFGICQRDAGIEILLNGELVWSSTDMLDGNGKPITYDNPPTGEKGG